ncbi:tRNA(fMet)-specific endonuclease VapC [Treponema bryantii]|uniref:tRNA(fMet)-specific endonuclease VapC n=1 Tax=Treponema bryantii TaxID=163 RepID=A0A1H9G235_9SPIR|nr:type II toxin-antitoxin system VapC family toxin [Treponema bryantii]SEQ44141.1 tRNA(fMet)-specific endonuclease VapC [Treponema bryantii]
MKAVYLLDTNTISEILKQNQNHGVIENLIKRSELCAICSTVWQEAVYGCELLPEGKKKEKIKSYLTKLKETFEILPYTRYASEICGEIKARCKENGKTAAFSDSQIAATAIANGMILVTHNTAAYTPIAEVSNLKYEDWWA